MRSEALIDPAQGINALAFRSERVLWPAIGALSAFAIFLLGRPYLGIVHDAVIYVGRAVADGDPDGLGRDLLFAYDGQAKFSLFTLILRHLVAWSGPGTASGLVVAFSMPVWFGALAVFASRLATGRLLWAMLVFASVLPATYGGYQVFRFAEQYAVPRPLAEAGVLAALAALAAGRRWMALGLLALASLLHPIMAAPGFAIWLGAVCLMDRRWLLAVGALGFALAAAVLADLPLASRLTTIIDPAWRAVLGNNPNLFPTLWPLGDWSTPIVQGVTLGIAASFVRDSHARLVLIAVIVTAVIGMAAAVVLGDWLSVLLVVQVQPWRAAWPLAVLGSACLPVAAVGLWRSGRVGRLALACLGLAWLSSHSPPTAIAAAAVAGVMFWWAGRYEALLTDRIVRIFLLVTVALGLIGWAWRATFGLEVWMAAPTGESYVFGLSVLQVYTGPVALGALIWILSDRRGPRVGLAAAGTLALAWLSLLCIDDRNAVSRRVDQWRPDPHLAAILPAADGDVLWARSGPMRSWTLAGRRSWVSSLQGASMVFSREQAMVWTDRMDGLLAAGLADIGDKTPLQFPGAPRRLSPTRDDIVRFCRAAGSPVALVLPLDGTLDLPAGLPHARYNRPAPEFTLAEEGGRVVWRAAADYAIVGCSAPLRGGDVRG